ncbi:MAG: enoyl-CoA hydratase/isomerase family protein [Rhizobiaceae bacterium]
MDFGGGDEIRFDRIGRAGVVTLTRPKALNALTHGMVKALARALTAWAEDESVALVVVRGEGRAFCAGGDILDVYRSREEGREAHGFFADEYRMNTQLAAFPKPYVSLIDGIVMGGGVGISCHGSHRVMTENAVLAMPEVGIGFFPDVGGSYLLSRTRGSYGMYLALTGGRIRAGDAVWAGLATHAIASSDIPLAFDALAQTGDADGALKPFLKTPDRQTDEATLHAIARHFGYETLEDIVASLAEARSDEFAKATLATMATRSPTSLKVTFRQIKAGAMLSMEECMEMEYRILRRMLKGHDFYEGIRAMLVDKGSTPQWRPSSLDAVSEPEVDAYFAPLPDGELWL